ncbi:MAG: response regulator [Thermodesulfobacteriota bacterium]
MSTVLVIDDEKFVLDVVRIALTKFGHSVYTAADGRQGIEKFDEGSFDLVITDLRMPGIDGKGVADHIRRSPRQWTPIIAITGTPWLSGGKLNDFDCIIPKPFTLKTLVDTVNNLSSRAVAAAV